MLVVMEEASRQVALPPLRLSEFHTHFDGPSRAPWLVVVPVFFEAVASSIMHHSHQAKATPQAFPCPVVKTTSREVDRKGVPWLGTFSRHTALPPRVVPWLVVATTGHEDPRGNGRQCLYGVSCTLGSHDPWSRPRVVVKVGVPRQWIGLNAMPHTCLRDLHEPFHRPWSRPLVVKVVMVIGQCLANLGQPWPLA
uniref:Uncharacterized protein n=1 Tax=Solanum tuberosum TaxID=4113 RepID=M1DJR2_SOLTU